MKLITALLATIAATLVNAADGIPVLLSPVGDATQIGELETLSLAVPAEWPKDVPATEGWQPVYYRGIFEVYVDNNDIGKNLAPKPGRPYLLSPNEKGVLLAIATDKDKTDIVSVDTWFSKMQLETIVLGYIQASSVEASSILSNLPQTPVPSEPVAAAQAASTELVGRLEKTGMIGRNRTGAAFKLVGPTGQTLAFVDDSEVPERIQMDEFVNNEVRITGFLEQKEGKEDVILRAKSLKKAF